MLGEIKRIQRRLTALICAGLVLTPLIGLSCAILFKLVSPSGLLPVLSGPALPVLLGGMLLWAVLHYRNYFNPVKRSILRRPVRIIGPEVMQKRVFRFSSEYWTLFLVYALAVPPIVISGAYDPLLADYLGTFMNFLLLQLAVAVLVGMPIYLLALDQIDHLSAHLNLDQLDRNRMSRALLIACFVPLLFYTSLLNTQWLRAGGIDNESIVIWLALALMTATTAFLVLRNRKRVSEAGHVSPGGLQMTEPPNESMKPESMRAFGKHPMTKASRQQDMQSTQLRSYIHKILRMYAILKADISRREHTENQLQAAERRYRDLVETAHDLVWSTDTEGRWTYLNCACVTIYGYEPEEMLQRRLHEFRAPNLPSVDIDAFNEMFAGAETVQFETTHLDCARKPHVLRFSARANRDCDGKVISISGTARDITEQRSFQKQLSYHAEHDTLTGLFNRHYFQQELERTVARVARSADTCALYYIDLDQFKYINDTLGHATGDRLLVEISALLSSHTRNGDLLARFGGDEFTLLLYNITESDVMRAAENFRSLCDDYKFTERGKTFNITCSIGVTLIDKQVSSAEEVLSHADLACNMAKTQGRNRTNLYNPENRDKAGMAADMGWAARVREMLEHDSFKLVYQPIASISDGDVRDYEVLVRMICEDGKVILPGGFMPAAERFGLIHSVDRWIVCRAINELAGLRMKGQDVCFSINLSGKAFEDESLLVLIKDMIDETSLNPAWLTFEITETAAIENLAAAEEFIASLKEIGCQFALDDFGSGFSSFAYLKHLPVDKLKIDGSFVKGMAHSTVDQAMVESMNQIAHALGKKTVAECVENAETLELLKQYNVDCAQGHYIGRPREIPMNLARGGIDANLALQQ